MFELLQYSFLLLGGALLVRARPAPAASSAAASSATSTALFQLAKPSLSSSTPSSIPQLTLNTTIVPITGASGSIGLRYEINQLQQQQPDQWNMFLLGMQAFQKMDPSDPMSWYQIAGIHGVPYVPYAGVNQCPGCPTTGYCTHSSTLFPNWHRTYVTLFEQSMQANALAVANLFTGADKQRYIKAATELRMPYWDWALTPAEGQDPFPQMFTRQIVTVNTPKGERRIANPLHSYSFGAADHSFMATQFTPDSDTTVRHPTFTMKVRAQLQADLYTTLTSNQGYTTFSTESLYAARDNYNPTSIEMLHDIVHVRTGGDMAFIPTAGFDPIFFLHHAAVDHAFALWQATYPDDWITPWAEIGSSYTYTSGTTEDGQSDLTPFRSNAEGGFWNPDAVRDHRALNYEYADIASGQSVAEIINTNYGGSTVNAVSNSTKRSDGSDRMRLEYIADIRADAMNTEGSFTIFLFDGDCDKDDADSWDEHRSLMATHSFFTGPEKKGEGIMISHAGASLTAGLRNAVKAGRLSSLREEDVTRYLKENLHWHIRMQHGRVVEDDEIPELKVSVLVADVQMPQSVKELPVWGKMREVYI